MTQRRVDVLVIGAGVSGLTTAVVLAEAGFDTLVRTREWPSETTSAAAGAIWGPAFTADSRIRRWSLDTLRELEVLATDGHSGVRMVSGMDACRARSNPPEWLTGTRGFQRCGPADLPAGFVDGWHYTAPVLDMPVYLRYLAGRLMKAGARIEHGVVRRLDDALTSANIVVNCTGFGARDLVSDHSLTPVRGQLVVADNPGIDRFFTEETTDSVDMTYFLPQGDRIILGSNAEVGRKGRRPDARTAHAIVSRCASVEPRLGSTRIREHRVGIRPARPWVRLERAPVGCGHVIHNYGHGGAGVTISWACARGVLALVREI